MCRKNRLLVLVIVFALSIAGCKKWDDHTKVGNPDLKENLLEGLTVNANLSKFTEYVKKAGLDSLLTSSKTYTVWAPTNDALQNLDPAIVNDVAKLRSFVSNHISNQSYYTRDAKTTLRIAMLNGKYNNFLNNKLEDATIVRPDVPLKNGVLHVIDKSIAVLPSLWEFVNSTTGQYAQNAFAAALNFNFFDSTLAIVDSISAITGKPVYKPGTGLILKNRFNEQVYNFKTESKQYTYFVIANAGFTTESDSLKVYFATGNAANTDTLAKWTTVKDLAVEGVYPASALTGLISRSGVPIPLDPSLIVETRKLSNGIVHILSKVDVRTAAKFPDIIVQGEFPSGFLSDRRGNTNFRERVNPVTQKDFTDMMITGHGVTTYYAFYRLQAMPSMKYNVYALGTNDFTGTAFTQNIIPKFYVPPATPAGLPTYTTLATLAHVVPIFTVAGAYDEKLLGE
ncbi:MAG: fasciclin domain-containing protein, partial [Chitinophagaceae bacterium]